MKTTSLTKLKTETDTNQSQFEHTDRSRGQIKQNTNTKWVCAMEVNLCPSLWHLCTRDQTSSQTRSAGCLCGGEIGAPSAAELNCTCYSFQTRRQKLNTNSFIIHRKAWASQAIYLKDDENIDPSQDHSSNGHLCLHTDVERLMGHGQGDNIIILQEGLNCNDDRVTAWERKQHSSKNYVDIFFSLFISSP